MASLVQRIKDAVGGADKDKSPEQTRLNRWFDNAQSSRKELDWKWFNYDLWVNGNHYAKWDKNTQQITTSPKTDGKPKIVINKTFTTLRSVRSHIMQTDPKADVTPYNMTEADIDQAQTLNHFLDYLHDHLHLRQSLRATLWHALKYSVGFWQVLYDDEIEDGQGGIVVNVIDPYDLYWDPAARMPAEARYAILAVRRNIADLKDDAKYKGADWDRVSADEQLSSSTLKSRLMQYEQGGSISSTAEKGDGTVIVKEFWYKEASEEEVEDDSGADDVVEGDKPKRKEKKTRTTQKIMLCTKVGEVVIREPFDTGLKRFPFFRLSSDIEPLSMYGHGWVKNLIPVNRLLERLESSAAEYNDVVNKGRYAIPKGAGVKTIVNENGQIIEHKRGFEPVAMQVPALNPSLFEQITNVNMYIEDIGCAHDAMLGRMPSGAHSGVAIEALQEGDSNNLSELSENTEEFLSDVYEYILEVASEKFQFARNVVTVTTTGERKYISLIGEGAAPEQQQQPGVTVIPAKNTVSVKIASYLAFTANGRQQAIQQLAALPQMANLPPEFILEAYAMSPIADIVKQMEEQAQKNQQAQLQQQQQQQQMQQQGQMQMNEHQAGLQQAQKAQEMQAQAQAQAQQAQQDQAAQPQGAGGQEAAAFIRQILNGQKPELPQVMTPEFIQYLDHFMQSKEGQSLGGEFLSVMQQVRDQAMLMLRQPQQGSKPQAGRSAQA